MKFFFLKGIARAIKLNLNLLYIDETAFKLTNNNYYEWRLSHETTIGGAENELKKQLNMILAIDGESIIHHKLENVPIDSKKFIGFLKEMIEKIGENKIQNYLIIYDNAKCHISKSVKKFALENKLKILTNIPYYSVFNAIEYVFLNIKSNLYKILIRNRKELKEKVESIINDQNIKNTIKKIYLSELRLYLKEIDDQKSWMSIKYIKIFNKYLFYFFVIFVDFLTIY